MYFIDSNNYDKNLFIFGEDVETKFGTIRFLTYREYLTNMPELSLITQNSLHIYYYYKKLIPSDNNEMLNSLLEIKEAPLLEIVLNSEEMLKAYLKIFQLVFDKSSNRAFDDILKDNENFMFVRNLIMDMNALTEEKVSPNEEIQKAFERSRRVKQRDSEDLSFVDIVTSIVASTNHTFEQVCNMTVFQVYAIYSRIGAIFNYQTTTLFATVAEKVNIESWNKHIDLFKTEKDALTRKEFDKKFGGLLGK